MLEQPISAIQEGLERLAGVSDIYVENQALRDENDRLRQWREAARRLVRENEKLRFIVNVPKREIPTAATGRVVGIGGGAFERSIVINVGSGDGVRLRLPVVNETGVVGRVVGVGQWSSRVLLVSDLNSRIPVRVERTGHLGVSEGRNSDLMQLAYLPQGATVREGDRLLTSGHGGIFPPDLQVGRVVSVDETGIKAEPFALLQSLDYLKVMDYRVIPPEMDTVEDGTPADQSTTGPNPAAGEPVPPAPTSPGDQGGDVRSGDTGP